MICKQEASLKQKINHHAANWTWLLDLFSKLEFRTAPIMSFSCNSWKDTTPVSHILQIHSHSLKVTILICGRTAVFSSGQKVFVSVKH